MSALAAAKTIRPEQTASRRRLPPGSLWVGQGGPPDATQPDPVGPIPRTAGTGPAYWLIDWEMPISCTPWPPASAR